MACPDRFSAFIGGIGSGKSYAGAVKMLIRASERRSLNLVIAPTYPMLRDASLRSFLGVGEKAIAEFHKGEMAVTMLNGSEILFRSADRPDRLRGPNISHFWIDEGGLCPPQTWDIAIGRLREGGRAGDGWTTATPKGRNWLYEKSDQMTIFRARTQDNPYLAREFITSLEAAYTGDFARQELGGEFVSFEGLVYDEFSRLTHVRSHPGPFVRYIAGVDEGYTNPAVILVAGEDSDGRLHIIEEFYKRRVLQGDVVGEAKRLHAAYKISQFYADPSAAGLIAEMRSESLPVTEADNPVMPGIQDVKARLVKAGDGKPRLTVDPSCVNLLAEIDSYCWKQRKAGVKDEPEKANDHAADALRYICYHGPALSTLSDLAGLGSIEDEGVRRWR